MDLGLSGFARDDIVITWGAYTQTQRVSCGVTCRVWDVTSWSAGIEELRA